MAGVKREASDSAMLADITGLNGAAGLDPLFAAGGNPAHIPALPGLDPHSGNRFSLWLLQPDEALTPAMRDALVTEIDISPFGIILAGLNFVAIDLVYFWRDPKLVILVMALFAIMIGASRLAAVMSIRHGPLRLRSLASNIYLMTTLAWCLVQGVLAGLVMLTVFSSLTAIAAAAVISVQGGMVARNYAAPRLSLGIMAAFNLPFYLGCVFSPDHWLLAVGAIIPSYVFAYWMTNQHFHQVAINSLNARSQSDFRACHDPLTGALNRFGLITALTNRIDVIGAPLALFYLDLDGFKPINDRHGHAAGDALLRMVAERLRRVSRSTDNVARLGGDEFVIVVSGISPAAAELFAARIISAITCEPYALSETLSVDISVSVGFACAPADCTAVADLFAHADQSLNIAKSKGKGVWHRN
jgi:diguanylate cyclase (GGDEF)-like protein